MSILEKESEIAELEEWFANPTEFRDVTLISSKSGNYAELKKEEGDLWESWENLSREIDLVKQKLGEFSV